MPLPTFSPNKKVVYLALFLAIGILSYFTLRPLFPLLEFQVKKLVSPNVFEDQYYLDKYATVGENTPNKGNALENPTNDRVIIPSVGVDIETYRNLDEDEALSKGAWIVPGSVNAGDTGEMVITGHRFEVLPPAENTFYNLDKLEIGKRFYVVENNTLFTYEVYDISVVKPEDYYIDHSRYDENVALLYTCTPLWSASDRLLVFGKLVS